MKIAITSEGNTLDSNVEQVFGRCTYFIVVDTENIEHFDAVKNEGKIQGHGAGVKAGQQVGELGVEAVITGNVGPNAENILNQLGIKIYFASGGTVRKAIDDFINKKLSMKTD